jgi:RHS repeat-associated protein
VSPSGGVFVSEPAEIQAPTPVLRGRVPRPNRKSGNQIVSNTTQSYRYDDRGNLISISRPSGDQSFQYNGANQLVCSDFDTGPATYEYDAFGRRTRKTRGSVQTRYVWAGEQLISEITEGPNGVTTSEYLYIPATYTLLAVRTDGRVYCYHNDHLGTPRRLTDEQGSVVRAAEYDAFGNANISVEHLENNWRFPGQYYDKESGLHYNRFRYYSPLLGRYVSRDPLTFAAGTNF